MILRPPDNLMEGNIMKPIKLTLRGIGPHEFTTLDFSALHSPAAICAPYGTGKTWLLEGIIGALYGSFAWYSGSVYDALNELFHEPDARHP